MSNQDAALKIVRTLRDAGYQALFAGGCVRDQLLGRPAKDYDVVTDAVPQQVSRCFRRTLEIGAQFGVVVVLIGSEQVEVATFRTEGGYQDGRHPGHVEFASMKEDASRRDFTVNGMFYDPVEEKVLDFVQGQQDLEKGILRTIGEPDARFSEDYLRMLRAIRFAVKLDFQIEPATWSSIQAHAGRITDISAERVLMEIEQILTHPNRAGGVTLLMKSGLAKAFFDCFWATEADFGVSVLENLPSAVDVSLAIAAMWAGFETKQAVEQCKKLKMSNSQLKHVRFLLEHRGVVLETELSLSNLKMLMHEPYFQDLILLQEAIQKAGGNSLEPLEEIRRRSGKIDPKEIHPEPFLNGHELMAMGALPGPMVGQLARELYIAQLEEKLENREKAEVWAKEWLKKHQKTSD